MLIVPGAETSRPCKAPIAAAITVVFVSSKAQRITTGAPLLTNHSNSSPEAHKFVSIIYTSNVSGLYLSIKMERTMKHTVNGIRICVALSTDCDTAKEMQSDCALRRKLRSSEDHALL